MDGIELPDAIPPTAGRAAHLFQHFHNACLVRPLKFKDKPLLLVILVSWGIAFFEYCFQVPANRWGSNNYSPYQLKIIQKVITLSVFVVFACFYFKTWPAWNHIAAFVCVLAAVAFAFWPSK